MSGNSRQLWAGRGLAWTWMRANKLPWILPGLGPRSLVGFVTAAATTAGAFAAGAAVVGVVAAAGVVGTQGVGVAGAEGAN